jgi:hypothetical protein
VSVTIQQRRDSAANWTAANPVLHQGEMAVETDTGKAKMGDGSTAWTSLGYWKPDGAADGVASVFGRTGAVVAANGDYTAAQVGAATPAAVATAAGQAQANAIAASLPTLAQASVSVSGTLALDTITNVTAATALTMTLPTATTGALIVVERAAASTANVAVTGNIRGVGAQTVTLSLASESEAFFATGGSWWPVAGHKTLSSLQALFAPMIFPTGDTTGVADSAAIAAALSAHGVAFLAGGQFWAHDLVLATGQWIIGQGKQATILSLAAGYTRLISSQNFASLTKTNTQLTGVPYHFGWRDLTIDGNNTAQAAQLSRPGTPSVANAGTPGSTSYAYRVTWVNALGETVGSAATTTATGNATLNGTNYNTVTRPTAPGGATGWNVYTGGRGQEALCNASPVPVATTTYNDQGTYASGTWTVMPRWNTTADVLVAVYGFGWQGSGFLIRNAAGLGLWTEWATNVNVSSSIGALEAYLNDFSMYNCLGGAWMCAGTHDMQANNFVLGQNCSGAGYSTLVVPFDGYVNGGTFLEYHVWGGGYDYGIYAASSGLEFDGQVEGGLLAEFFMNGSLNRVKGKLFTGGIQTATAVALVLGTQVNNIFADVKVENCGGGVLDLTGFGGTCLLRIDGSFTGSATVPSPLYLGTLDGNSVLDLHVTQPSGAVVAGSGLFRAGEAVSASSGAFGSSLSVSGASVGAGLADPLSIGFASTTDPRAFPSGAAAMFAANAACYAAFIGYGQSVSTLRISVGTSSGNISVGTYGNGSQPGSARLPHSQKSTTGAIACPASGVATVTLISAVTIAAGDYGAISADNTSATFQRVTTNSATSWGVLANQSSAHPLPATAAAANGGGYAPWVATP